MITCAMKTHWGDGGGGQGRESILAEIFFKSISQKQTTNMENFSPNY